MKRLFLNSIIILTIILSSCSEDFLDTKPLTTLTEVDFYKSVEDFELALVGCYDGLQRLNSFGYSFPVVSEYCSDYCFAAMGAADGYAQQVMDEFNINRSSGESNILQDAWNNYYYGLYRINKLLYNLNIFDWGDNLSTKTRIESEAKFLRAYFYFDMVRLWEKVPLVLVPTNENLPQAEVDEIYEQIVDDLLFTAQNGDTLVKPGRVNKYVAKAFIARVFLFYTGYYDKQDLVGKVTKEQALAGLEDIIESKKYGLVKDFKNLWPAASTILNENGNLETTFAGKDNKEVIFAIKHNITSDWGDNKDGNHWIVYLGLRSQKNIFSPYGQGWGGATVVPSFYESFVDGDVRKEASIIAIEEEGLDFDNSDQREYTGYTNKKYTPLAMPDGTDLSQYHGGINFQISQYQDYIAMRYADVLLMAAELGSSKAQEYFDEVRKRANLESEVVTVENILKERRFEFCFEGICYWDMLRQGLDKAAQMVDVTMTVLSGGKPETKRIDGNNLKKTRGFQQIPHNQISLSNGVLVQNPGW